jgi:hypothetical protein
MRSYLHVAVGSAIGLARFTLGGWLQRRLDGALPRAGALASVVLGLLATFAGIAPGRALIPTRA